ncbi:UDP-N-acetylmuramate dehydrogenase [Salsuginibacillus kocurii]|uniref:UDP-N-acetylmuramate dehydrogenase n=1 Tax=Salsuginibacillus kocurii TaxID=427078 RepID=UPI0003799ECF|nr:UDP-N-acetylmuramate dehydrogenase [Salsuginibacillus kocurii]
MEELVDRLQKVGIEHVKQDEPLSKHTTWRIGGPADIFIEPRSSEELEQTIKVLKDNQLSWRVIGRGSNLLVSDAGIRGAVIKLGDKMSRLDVSEDGKVQVGAGYSLIKLATILSKKGWSGLEFAGGIPGNVGGAVFMNAGAHKSEMAHIVEEALILYPSGELKWVPNEDLNFSYRTSSLQFDGGICVEARLKLKAGDKEAITKEMQKNKDYRRDTQPWNHPCAGSVFRNPLPDHAGHLIEKAGLKGFKKGGAQVSTLHANFIVNVDEAKAEDVVAIIEHAKAEIQKQYGIKLETEVEIVR